MTRNYYIHFCWWLIAICCTSYVHAQTWQNTVGTPGTDLHWQGIANTAGYITVGQTDGWSANTQTNILLTQFDGNGNVLWSKTVSMPASVPTTNYRFEPRDMSVAAAVTDPATGVSIPSGYYITGVAQNITPNIGTNMFVLRVDGAGNVVWLRLNVLPTLSIQQSEGIAVVTLSGGDVIAVGNARVSNNAGLMLTQVIGTRISAAGNVLWSNIYTNVAPAGTAGTASMLAHEATLDANMISCTTTPAPTIAENGVVVTGEISNHWNLANYGAGPHLFVMFIDANGTECWRNAYPVTSTTVPSAQMMSAGYDIAHDAVNNHYIVVGRAYINGVAGAQNTTYIVRLNSSGVFVCGSLINIVTTAGGTTSVANAFARALVTNNIPGTLNNMVVAGLDITSNATYLMSIPGANVCPQTPTWLREYLQPPSPGPSAIWTPVAGFSGNGVSESIVVSGNSAATFNYFITTNANNGSATTGNLDMHVIRTDASGNVLTACPAVSRNFSQTMSGTHVDLAMIQQSDNSWTNLSPSTALIELQQDLCTNVIDPCVVDATFIAVQPTPVGCQYTFDNTSTGNGSLTYAWNFGDPASGSNNTSNLQHPSHLFSATGTYTVCLTTTNVTANGTTCTDTECQVLQVVCSSTGCSATSDFCYTINGYQVSFNNLATGTGTLSYTWAFGDGSISNAANPVKTYSAPGTYTVCLTTLSTMPDGTQCCNNCCKTITINPPCSVNANFRYCVNGSLVSLTNLSTSISSAGVTYAWYLNNATAPFSTAFTPPTQILSVGTHTICIEATRTTATGSCSKYTCKTITINPSCNTLARFTHTACLNSLSATFNNTSSGAASYTWNFGDPASGSNNISTATNPSHTFSGYGTYVVCLTAQGSATCRYRVCQTVQIAAPNCTTACPVICPTCPVAPMDAPSSSNEENTEPANKGTDYLNDGSDIQVFPNPANDAVQVAFNSLEGMPILLRLTDIQGKLIRELPLNAQQHELSLDLTDLAKGMYLIAIHHDNGTISGAKLMKE